MGAIGTIGVLYFALVFDTTVADEGRRMHNIGLMNDRLVGIAFFGMIALRACFPDRLTFGKPKRSLSTRTLVVIAISIACAVAIAVIFAMLTE